MLVLHRRRETHHSWLQFRAMVTQVRSSCAARLGPNMWQIEGAFKEYSEGKSTSVCGMETRVCVAIVENEGDNNFRLPHRKKSRNFVLSFG